MTDKPEKKKPAGYGNPPKSSRWKKGQSGNPKGRPHTRNLSTAETIRDILKEKIVIVVAGKRRSVSPQAAAVFKSLTTTISSGKPRDLKIFFELLHKYGKMPEDASEEGEWRSYADMKKGADDVMTKLRTIFDRTVTDDTERQERRAEMEKQEVALLMRSPPILAGLKSIWASHDKSETLAPKTHLQELIERHNK